MCLYDGIRRHSSAGQSARFTSVRSGVRSPLSPPKGRLQTKRFAVFYLFCKLREGSEPHRRCCGGLPSGRAATDIECERFAKQTNEAKRSFDPLCLHQKEDCKRKGLQSFICFANCERGANPTVDVAAVCRQAEPQPTKNAKGLRSKRTKRSFDPLCLHQKKDCKRKGLQSF